MTQEIAKAQFVEATPEPLANQHASALDLIAGNATVYTGLRPEDKKDKVALYNAINNAQEIWEYLETNPKLIVECVNIIAHDTTIADMNDDTVELDKVRVILVGKDGKAWSTSSEAAFSAVQQIFALFGEPYTWDEPLKIRPYKKKGNKSGMFFLTLELV